METARGTDVEVGDEGLIRLPTRLGGVCRRKEVAGAPEVVGEEETKTLADVVALHGRAGSAGVGEDGVEDGYV